MRMYHSLRDGWLPPYNEQQESPPSAAALVEQVRAELQHLVEAADLEGTLSVKFSPRADDLIDDRDAAPLRKVGHSLATTGKAIYVSPRYDIYDGGEHPPPPGRWSAIQCTMVR